MQNGIPWWYFHKLARPLARDTRCGLSTRTAASPRHIPVERVIGSVVYPASEVVRPGVIRVIEGNRFTLGEIDGSDTPRVRAIATPSRRRASRRRYRRHPLGDLAQALGQPELQSDQRADPCHAGGHLPAGPTRALAAGMMREAQAIGEKLGVQFKVSLDKRIAGAQAVGAHKTSMLQDVEAGRPLELQALVGAVLELGRHHRGADTGDPGGHALASLLARPCPGMAAVCAWPERPPLSTAPIPHDNTVHDPADMVARQPRRHCHAGAGWQAAHLRSCCRR
jgi:2-dehydropantoate 2-reductase